MNPNKKFPFAHKQSMLIVGKYYRVAHAVLEGAISHKKTYVPIIPNYHADPQFGVKEKHFHVDGRFKISKRMQRWYRVDERGKTNDILFISSDAPVYKFKKIIFLNRICIRTTTGIKPPPRTLMGYGKNNKYWNWYNGFVGKQCKGKICPHKGTKMIEQDGKLVCPLHNLVADIEKEVIVYPI